MCFLSPHLTPFFTIILDGNLIRLSCMWNPHQSLDTDRHHHIFFRCKHCRPLKRACQAFGHIGEVTCDLQSIRTVMDKPVCEAENCPEPDFMIPTHNRVQWFSNKDSNGFCVFFHSPKDVDNFFTHYKAADCLDNNGTWCQFLATLQLHKNYMAHVFEPLTLTVREEDLKLYYVSGCLPPMSKG